MKCSNNRHEGHEEGKQGMTNEVTKNEQVTWMGSCMIPLEHVCHCSLDESINKAISYIIDRRYSHIPVLDGNKKVVGIFSVSTLMEIVRRNAPDRNCGALESIRCDLDIINHSTEVFKFVSIRNTIAEVRAICDDVKKEGKHIGMFLVTAEGGKDEPLYGIFTEWDFSKVLVYKAKEAAPKLV